MIYWEVIEKRKHDGGIVDEFMLACNNLRKDLTHANEYVVGMTLKLIGRIALREIIELLLVPIYENGMGHVEAFVRRNAIECLYHLYLKFGEEVLSGLEDKLLEFLAKETDINTKRNAIRLLFLIDYKRGLEYIKTVIDNEGIDSFADIV